MTETWVFVETMPNKPANQHAGVLVILSFDIRIYLKHIQCVYRIDHLTT
jgi:hypothetical protein